MTTHPAARPMADIDTLTERLRRARRTLDRQLGQAEAIARQARQYQDEIAQLAAEVETLGRAGAVLTSIGEQRQADAQHTIEQLVTQGLRTIFDDDLSFHVVPVVRGNRPEIDFVVRSTVTTGPQPATVDTPVMDARGGGLAATIGFLLRLVVLLLRSRERGHTALLLDETFAHVSAEYEPRLAEFIRDLVDKTGVQVIMVTHSDAFSDLADTRYRLSLQDGLTRATRT